MDLKELKKEAEEWIKDHSGLIGGYKFVKYDYDSMQKAYLAGAEPRGKRIAELEAENKQIKNSDTLCKLIGEQKIKIAELEEQIEKLQKDSNEWQETLAKEIELVRKRSETIKQLEAQNLQLLKEWRVMDKAKQKAERKVAELMDDVSTLEQDCKRLEAQIEKMKCCYNCANDTLEPPEVIGNGICEHCKNHDKWELGY